MPSFEGILEIDERRGVIYFHSKENGFTMLRVCGLPTPIPTDRAVKGDLLDLTWGCQLANWTGKPNRLQNGIPKEE